VCDVCHANLTTYTVYISTVLFDVLNAKNEDIYESGAWE
jgi:hypothetical protein